MIPQLMKIPNLLAAILLAVIIGVPAQAQLLKQGDYGVGVTVAIYQFDEVASKPFPLVSTLKVAATTPAEEVELLARNLGIEDLRIRHVKSVGLREGETFTDTQPMNERPFTFTITTRLVTRGDLTLDFVASYADKVLLEAKSVTANSYDTLVLRGQPAAFAVREFEGPRGREKVPETRALLVTITPVIQNTRALQNKPSDLSRPTDQFGSKVVLDPSDIFVMPALLSRAPLTFAPGSRVQGSITLEGIITPEGRVTNVRILDTPDPALNPKAIEAFRKYRFTPAKLNGRDTYATFRETILLERPRDL
jgi:TonB family protein